MAGAMHPLAGLDHLIAMLAVGVWSALTVRRLGLELLWAPSGFAAMLLLGALLGLGDIRLPAVEPMIAVSLLVFGLLVVLQLRLPGLGCAALVGAFAIFHGVAHGNELAGQPNASATLVGMLLATVFLHAIGIGIGWVLRSSAAWLPRMVGAGVVLFGTSLLLQLVRP